MGDPLKNTMKALTGQRVSFDPSQAQRVQHCLTTGLVSKKVLLPFFLLHLYASTSERERENYSRLQGEEGLNFERSYLSHLPRLKFLTC